MIATQISLGHITNTTVIYPYRSISVLPLNCVVLIDGTAAGVEFSCELQLQIAMGSRLVAAMVGHCTRLYAKRAHRWYCNRCGRRRRRGGERRIDVDQKCTSCVHSIYMIR